MKPILRWQYERITIIRKSFAESCTLGMNTSRQGLIPCIVAFLTLVISFPVQSQEPPPPPELPVDAEAVAKGEERRRFAITDLTQVDADYHNQGEYAGELQVRGVRSQVGVQVRALGDSQFEGLLYRGGLPGNGYDGSAPTKLAGSRSSEQVVLTGSDVAVSLQTGYAAVVKTLSGERLGFLQPVTRVSQTEGEQPPANAIVLFDGKNVDRLKDAKVTADGLLEVGFETKQSFQNFTIHGEFRTPYMPYARGQERANSGFYLQRRYEVQVLDSFALVPQFNDSASLYRFKAPDLNMCFPPLRWQTYDITFQAARFSACGQKLCKARVTVRHNGVIVQNQLELENKTGSGKPEGPEALPIHFQNHRNPVNYRNIWLVEHGDTCSPAYLQIASPACADIPCFLARRPRHLFLHH